MLPWGKRAFHSIGVPMVRVGRSRIESAPYLGQMPGFTDILVQASPRSSARWISLARR
mgnify:CR=1 FL=1